MRLPGTVDRRGGGGTPMVRSSRHQVTSGRSQAQEVSAEGWRRSASLAWWIAVCSASLAFWAIKLAIAGWVR